MLDVPTIAGVPRKGTGLRPLVEVLKAAAPYPGDALGDGAKGLVGLIAGAVSKPLRVKRLAALWVKIQAFSDCG